MTKRIRSYIYTQGKFGKGFRETLDTENKFLYSHGLKKYEPDFYKAHVQNYEPELFRTLNKKL